MQLIFFVLLCNNYFHSIAIRLCYFKCSNIYVLVKLDNWHTVFCIHWIQHSFVIFFFFRKNTALVKKQTNNSKPKIISLNDFQPNVQIEFVSFKNTSDILHNKTHSCCTLITVFSLKKKTRCILRAISHLNSSGAFF